MNTSREVQWILEEPSVFIGAWDINRRSGGWLATLFATNDACVVAGNDDGTIAWTSCTDQAPHGNFAVEASDGGAYVVNRGDLDDNWIAKLRPDGSAANRPSCAPKSKRPTVPEESRASFAGGKTIYPA